MSSQKTERTLISNRTNSLLGVQIISSGSYVPDIIVSNEQLRDERGFDPDWIQQRTGILSRRHAPQSQATSDMAVEAAKAAIEKANVDPADIDLLLVGTFTPDFCCPSTACLVQDRLGLDCPAVDLQAACSGFMYALVTGSQFVATGNSKLALIVGADCNSRIVDQSDQKIAPLFGDGAGAVLMTRGDATQGLVCYQLGSDGSGGPLLQCTAGGTRVPNTAADVAAGNHFLQMDGRNVFKWAVRVVQESIELVLEKAGMQVGDVSLFLIHQANIRIVDAAMEKLGIPAAKVAVNLDQYGNTSAGSIPICLDEAQQAGRIKSGDVLLMCGFGGGLTWGTALYRW
ncbi:MAG: ketoacyl-ACP synthase III [Planctomycetota bacterium]|nr:ketoacyl-ACP synthase III [Planctomycetota bacterium]MDA1162734.1 ketoacyl-ACP synthase III [Planctomycetota bacterium]